MGIERKPAPCVIDESNSSSATESGFTMSEPEKDSNGNFVDSNNTTVQTPDGKAPISGEQVTILNNGVEKKGWWDGSNFVENK